jgi:hypothetical protein
MAGNYLHDLIFLWITLPVKVQIKISLHGIKKEEDGGKNTNQILNFVKATLKLKSYFIQNKLDKKRYRLKCNDQIWGR